MLHRPRDQIRKHRPDDRDDEGDPQKSPQERAQRGSSSAPTAYRPAICATSAAASARRSPLPPSPLTTIVFVSGNGPMPVHDQVVMSAVVRVTRCAAPARSA